MKRALIWGSSVFLLLLLTANIFWKHVKGVKSEKQWYLSQLDFDFSAKLDSAEKGGQALLTVTHGHIDRKREAMLKAKLQYSGWVDLFLYRADGKLDLMIPGKLHLVQGDSVYVNTDSGLVRFFRNGKQIAAHPLYNSLRGRPF